VESLADVLPMLVFFYLAAAVLQRRKVTWLVAVVSRRSRGVRRYEVAGLGRSGGGAGRRSARARALGRSSWAAAAAWGTRGRDGRDGRDGRLDRDRAGGGVGGPGPRPSHSGGRLVWL
jgi:hypothetical protein